MLDFQLSSEYVLCLFCLLHVRLVSAFCPAVVEPVWPLVAVEEE